MLTRILDTLFGCAHRRYSFPITVKKGARSRAASLTGTYVACLECGKEMPYDWKEMKVVTPASERVPVVSSLATKQAS
ncbi:MAG: hypothetical protein JO159_02560 [Acidobacteria bacterium]|nr:hypothetical protein [Acidobacteriota bacterium]